MFTTSIFHIPSPSQTSGHETIQLVSDRLIKRYPAATRLERWGGDGQVFRTPTAKGASQQSAEPPQSLVVLSCSHHNGKAYICTSVPPKPAQPKVSGQAESTEQNAYGFNVIGIPAGSNVDEFLLLMTERMGALWVLRQTTVISSSTQAWQVEDYQVRLAELRVPTHGPASSSQGSSSSQQGATRGVVVEITVDIGSTGAEQDSSEREGTGTTKDGMDVEASRAAIVAFWESLEVTGAKSCFGGPGSMGRARAWAQALLLR